MKKILSLLSVFVLLTGVFLPGKIEAQTETGYFVVTAYYSPLPDQKYYYTGTYEDEIILNGKGTHGASGKEVFSGMIAAPDTYSFGTKIYLEGLGIGEVSDRGGAIVSAGNRGYEHDRVDVWMGYGDEGLKRAMYWGKKTVKGYVVHSSQDTTIDYEKIPTPDWAVEGLDAKETIFDYSLGKGSDAEKVKKLQEFFQKLGLYNGEINGVYNSEIIAIVYDFQIDYGVIKPGDEGEGYWGNKTRGAFKVAYLNGDFDEEEDIVPNLEGSEQENEGNEDIRSVQENEGNNYYCSDENSTENIENEVKTEYVKELIAIEGVQIDVSIFENALEGIENIEKLQNILIDLGYYNGEITGIYQDIVDAIYDFQLENNVISSESETGAGNFGPKTREKMKLVYIEYLETRANEVKIKREEEKRKKELQEKFKQIQGTAIEKATNKVEPINGVKFGETSARVREFQLLLKELGYFDQKDTAIFGETTKEALMNFQADANIISTKDDAGAGIVGPKTIEALITKLSNNYMYEELNKSEVKEFKELAYVVEKL